MHLQLKTEIRMKEYQSTIDDMENRSIDVRSVIMSSFLFSVLVSLDKSSPFIIKVFANII